MIKQTEHTLIKRIADVKICLISKKIGKDISKLHCDFYLIPVNIPINIIKINDK